MKRSVTSAVTTEYSRQPPINYFNHKSNRITTKIFRIRCLLWKYSESDADCYHKNIIKNKNTYRNQRPYSCRLGSLRFSILPYQKKNKTHNRNTTAQKPPSESAVINNLRLVLLGDTALRTDNRLIVNYFSAILAIHNFSLLKALILRSFLIR